MPKRRKRRLKPNWGPILWTAVILNVAAGLWFSPITSVRKVRVEGAEMWDRGRIVASIQTLRRVPALNMNPRRLETLLFEHSAVQTVDFRRSMFGSASLTLEYRTPIARIADSDRLMLDANGAQFRTGTLIPEALPEIKLHASALKPSLSIAGAWPAPRIAELLAKIPSTIPHEGLQVEVDSEGAVCLNMKQAARIEMGGVDRLEEKLRALEGLLNDNPRLLQEVELLNIVEPTRPAVKPRKGGQP